MKKNITTMTGFQYYENTWKRQKEIEDVFSGAQ